MKNLLLVLFLFFSHLFIICQDCDFNTKFKGNSNLYISDNSWFHKAIRWYSSYETNMPRYNWDNPSGYWPQVEAKVFTDEDVTAWTRR